LDPFNAQMDNLIQELNRVGGSPRTALPHEPPVAAGDTTAQAGVQIARMEAALKQNPSNLQVLYQLAMAYVQSQQSDKALILVDRLLNDPKADNTSLLFAAQICHQLNQLPRVEQALGRLTKATPDTPEVWFDLAVVQARQQKETEAIDSLRTALEGSARRRAKDSNAPNLYSNALSDPSFNNIRQSPAFQKLVASSK
ncbi:MAG TPA: tetratricopeptide repeat protein, partial [Pyrinomonadaceae bacterium]|nr:tetratricopeptide repeat protein [Pyrinomonadaceae bacterium]